MSLLKPCSSIRHLIRSSHNFTSGRISYRFGSSTDPLIPLTMSQILLESVDKHPEKDCIISHHQSLVKTYQDLEVDSNKLSHGLKSLGVNRGDPVGIWSGNCYEWIIVQFATAKLGAILVNINPGYKDSELEYCLNLIGVKILISNQKYKSSNYVEILNNVCPRVISSECSSSESPKVVSPKVVSPKVVSSKVVSSKAKIPTLEKVVFLDSDENIAPRDALKLSDLMNGSSHEHIADPRITFDDAINVQFTSGTTGTPKGATLTHFGVINNAYFSGKRFFKRIPAPKVCLPNPLYHCFGSINGSLQTIIHDGTVILPGIVANPSTTLEAIDTYQPDILYGTPTMFTDIANEENVSRFDTKSVKRLLMSGAPCPPELVSKLGEIFPKSNVCIPYGTTETSPVITSTDPVDHDRKYLINTVGTVLDHAEIKIADPTSGDVIAIGERGEIMTRGYHTFLGYFNQREKTNEVLDEKKWYHTG